MSTFLGSVISISGILAMIAGFLWAITGSDSHFRKYAIFLVMTAAMVFSSGVVIDLWRSL